MTIVGSCRFRRLISGARSTLGCAIALATAACGSGRDAARTHQERDTGAPSPSALSMCGLMPKEAVNDAIGTAYTRAEPSGEKNQSSCHYSTEMDPTGLSLELTWIRPSDYSTPAEHLALQKAMLGGARLGGKLTDGSSRGASGGSMHIASGPVEGVGDEATQNLLLLSARKGDYMLMVQIIPDVAKLMSDSTAGRKVLEQEREIAREVLSKV